MVIEVSVVIMQQSRQLVQLNLHKEHTCTMRYTASSIYMSVANHYSEIHGNKPDKMVRQD